MKKLFHLLWSLVLTVIIASCNDEPQTPGAEPDGPCDYPDTIITDSTLTGGCLPGPCMFTGVMFMDHLIGERVFLTAVSNSADTERNRLRIIVPDTVTFIPQDKEVTVLVSHNSRFDVATGEGIAKEVFQAAGTTYWRGVRFLRLYNPNPY